MDVIRTKLFGAFTAAALACLILTPTAAFASPDNPVAASRLFADAPRPADLENRELPEVSRTRYVTVDHEALESARLRGAEGLVLDLFPDTVLHVTYTRDETALYADYVWMGEVVGDPGSSVALSVSRGMTVGEINSPQHGLFLVTYAGEGVHSILEFNPDVLDPCAMDQEAHAVHAPTMRDDEITELARSSDDGSLIDVLVLYTPSARNTAGGENAIRNAIDSFIAQTNNSYNNSAITPRVRLVHAALTNYTESPNGMGTDLSNLRSTTNGIMPEAHTLRNQYGADLVALISMSTGACGIAYLMTNPSVGFQSNAFSVTRYTCGGLTFAHELGHNQGSNHDHQNASNGAYCYSFGYRTPNSQWRTVMAYAPGTRISYFSNPDITFNGFPMGISGNGCPSNAADNARSIDNTAIFVANFRKSVVGNPPPESFTLNNPPADAVGVSTGVNFTWQTATYAQTYDLTVSTNSDLSDPIIYATDISTTNYSVGSGTLEFFTDYYWSVQAFGFGGDTVSSPEVQTFRTRSQGDITGDGQVGFNDLSLVLGQFGQTGSGLDGDVNGDGQVGFADLSIILSTFGQGS